MGVTERSAAELQDEARLIEAAKRDRKAFAALYDRYFDQIYSYCYYHSGRREEAEDLASETFQRALEGLENFEWRGIPYSAWLYKVASNLMSKRRRRPPWIELPDPIAGSGENDPERLWLRREQGDELPQAVRKLARDPIGVAGPHLLPQRQLPAHRGGRRPPRAAAAAADPSAARSQHPGLPRLASARGGDEPAPRESRSPVDARRGRRRPGAAGRR